MTATPAGEDSNGRTAIERLADRRPRYRFPVTPTLLEQPIDRSTGWRSLAELELVADTDGFTLSSVLAAERANGTPAGPHAVHALRTLTQPMIYTTAAAIRLFGAASPIDPGRWFLRRVGDGPNSVQHAMVRPGVDVDAGHAAERLVATIEPLVAAIRAQTRVGPRTLWGYVLDMSRFAMMIIARELDQDRQEAWAASASWAEALYSAGAPRLSEPQLQVYDQNAPNGTWAIRGACCLDFVDRAHGYCSTCPIATFDDRRDRWLDPNH